jgi:hypothetical protein
MTIRDMKEQTPMNRKQMITNLDEALFMLRDWIDTEDKLEECDLTFDDKEWVYTWIKAVYEDLSSLKDDELTTWF